MNVLVPVLLFGVVGAVACIVSYYAGRRSVLQPGGLYSTPQVPVPSFQPVPAPEADSEYDDEEEDTEDDFYFTTFPGNVAYINLNLYGVPADDEPAEVIKDYIARFEKEACVTVKGVQFHVTDDGTDAYITGMTVTF